MPGIGRGMGDKGSPSTFLRVRVYDNNAGVVEVWRADESSGWKYEHRLYLEFVG